MREGGKYTLCYEVKKEWKAASTLMALSALISLQVLPWPWLVHPQQ